MKKLLLAIACMALLACNPETPQSEVVTKDVAYYEIGGADYWVYQYNANATKAELKEVFKQKSNSTKTTYFFYFPEGVDVSEFENGKFNDNSFLKTVLSKKPKYGFYRMMPADTTVYEDGIDNVKLAVSIQ